MPDIVIQLKRIVIDTPNTWMQWWQWHYFDLYTNRNQPQLQYYPAKLRSDSYVQYLLLTSFEDTWPAFTPVTCWELVFCWLPSKEPSRKFQIMKFPLDQHDPVHLSKLKKIKCRMGFISSGKAKWIIKYEFPGLGVKLWDSFAVFHYNRFHS